LSGWWRLAELLSAMTVACIGIVFVAAIVVGRLWAQQAKLVRFRAEKAEAEAELARKDRLSNLGQLTASIAHELRNPLSTIRNSLHVIQETAEKRAVDIERPLSRVTRCIQRCERLLDDLVEYSAAGAPARRPTRLDIWLGEVLDDQKLPDGVAIHRDFGTPDGIVDLDTKRFRVVIANLLENAAQAIAAGSAPHSPHVIKVTTRATDAITIQVEDDGCGMSPEILPRVFEPLFSTKGYGTGLGMPTVKQVVEQHGGTIAIETELGRGTTVVIVLPLLAHQRAAA
jgi:signal transduction histidine kinase